MIRISKRSVLAAIVVFLFGGWLGLTLIARSTHPPIVPAIDKSN